MAAASVGVAQPQMMVPSVAMMRMAWGSIPSVSSLTISQRLPWRSSSGSGGPSRGLMRLRTTQYRMKMPASRNPGPKHEAYSSATDTPMTGPMTTSITLGGTRMPRVPPAVMAPADMGMS